MPHFNKRFCALTVEKEPSPMIFPKIKSSAVAFRALLTATPSGTAGAGSGDFEDIFSTWSQRSLHGIIDKCFNYTYVDTGLRIKWQIIPMKIQDYISNGYRTIQFKNYNFRYFYKEYDNITN